MTILWASLTGPGMKILVNVFYKSLREDLVKILVACCQRPLHEDLIIRTCARSCKDLREDAIRICTTSSHKDLGKTSVKIFMYYAPWNPCKSVIEGHSRERRRSLYQNPRESVKSSTAPLRERSDTHKVTRRLRISALCRGLRACAIEMHTWTSQKRPFMREFTVKMPQANTGTTLRRSFCASLRSRNAHGRQNLQQECRLS